jgi:hypothetical protein
MTPRMPNALSVLICRVIFVCESSRAVPGPIPSRHYTSDKPLGRVALRQTGYPMAECRAIAAKATVTGMAGSTYRRAIVPAAQAPGLVPVNASGW